MLVISRILAERALQGGSQEGHACAPPGLIHADACIMCIKQRTNDASARSCHHFARGRCASINGIIAHGCVGYWTSPSAFMVSWTFGLAPIRAMNALMLGHFARSILWTLVQLITVNR
jgi:hypothetical protein